MRALFVLALLLATPAAADEKQKCVDDGAALDIMLPLMVQAVAAQRNTEDYRKLGPEGQKIWEETYSEKALAKQYASEFTCNCVQRYNCQEAKDVYQRGAILETAQKSYQQLMYPRYLWIIEEEADETLFLAVCGALAASPVLGADYSTIDIGYVYYINRFGKNNSIVIVERKLGDPAVKVRDAETGVTSVEKASDLLSETELKREERKHKVMG